MTIKFSWFKLFWRKNVGYKWYPQYRSPVTEQSEYSRTEHEKEQIS